MNIQTSVGEIAVTGEFGTAWKLEHTKTELEPGLELVHLHLETEGELPPPQFSLQWFIPLVDIQTRWAPMVNYNRYLPRTGRAKPSRISLPPRRSWRF